MIEEIFSFDNYKTFVNNKIGSISKESSELTSLNASVSAGIVIYEAVKQRG